MLLVLMPLQFGLRLATTSCDGDEMPITVSTKVTVLANTLMLQVQLQHAIAKHSTGDKAYGGEI
ncbi:MAG: hypothetical protein Q9N62_04595 [Ghiorsea sp.]|nr:hypothetical protein [Ghiorsea sp.]